MILIVMMRMRLMMMMMTMMMDDTIKLVFSCCLKNVAFFKF